MGDGEFHAERASEAVKELRGIFEGRRVVASGGYLQVDPVDGAGSFDLADIEPIFLGDFADRQAQVAFFDLLVDQYENGFWWEDGLITGPLPAPFSLTLQRNRKARAPHVVMRALLEKRRATLGKDALFVIYNLYRRMPDPMFRVILSFL